MRLHRLHFGSIGPFTHVDPIDFDALARTGLFLIEGPTGAGKSTVIDAVVFALYGTVAGRGADVQRLVSTFADLRAESPFADLSFEVQGGLYRVRRSPRFERPKQRGEGTTTQNPRAQLYRLSDRDQITASIDELDPPIANGVAQVGAAVHELIGLDHGQFTQTMVLPQGEFETFLKAKARDRRVLLQDLFDTGVYADIEAALQARRREVERAFDDARRAVRERVAQFAQAARLEPDDESALLSLATDHPALREVLSSHVASARQQEEAASGVRTRAVQAHEAAQQAHASAETAARRIAERLDVDRQLAELAADTAAAAERDRLLHQLDAAVVPLGAHEQLQQRIAQRQAAELRHVQLADAFPELAEATEPQILAAAEACADERRALESDLQIEAGILQRQLTVQQDEESLAQLKLVVDSLEGERSDLDADYRLLSGELPEVSARAAALPACSELVDRLGARRNAATSLLLHQQRLESAKSEAAEQHVCLEEATGRFLSLQSQFRQQSAAMLAGLLAEGSACPVCGSVEHPAPAVAGGQDGPTNEQVDAAAEEERIARSRMQVLQDAVAAEQAECTRLADLAGDDLESLESALQDAHKQRREAQDSADRLQVITERMPALQGAQSDVHERLRHARDSVVALEAGLTTARSALAADQLRLREIQGDFASVALRSASLGERETALRALGAAAAAVAVATTEAAAAQAALDRALSDANIADEAALLALQSLMPQRASLREAAQERLRRQAAVDALRQGLEDVDTSLVVDTRASAEALAAAAEALEAATAEWQIRAQVVQDSTARVADIESAIDTLAGDQAGAATLLSLSSLVSGERGSSISLPLYAVRRRFRDVVEVANQHLRRMLQGRLVLIAHDDPSDGRESVGLALNVRDDVSGQERDAATVSGGEAFCCALALALGLAEVVSAEQGQLRTESLFVDEGFGSLDADTLAEVTEVLESLRSDGRMVAVVSHVAAMQEQIRQKITVHRVPGGPSEFSVVLP